MRTVLSFCTTCRNRLWQLQQTFSVNAEIVANDPRLEWVIVNYGSADGLAEFARGAMKDLPENICYVEDHSGQPWHASRAKNLAHRAARGRFLFNLDCDNYIGLHVETMLAGFAQGHRIGHFWSGLGDDGTCGRIGIEANLFHQIGGYDESMLPMGFQDIDLLRRARIVAGQGFFLPAEPGSAIPNTADDKIANCAGQGRTWSELNRENRRHSEARISSGRIIANESGRWSAMNATIIRGAGATKPQEKETVGSTEDAMHRSSLSVPELLRSMGKDHQRVRQQLARAVGGRPAAEVMALRREQEVTDIANLARVEAILMEHGWIGPEAGGTPVAADIFLILQHAPAPVQKKYIPLLRKAVGEGKARAEYLAILEDAVAVAEGRPQAYGTHVARDKATGAVCVRTMESLESVDQRRREAGMEPISEYLRKWRPHEASPHAG